MLLNPQYMDISVCACVCILCGRHSARYINNYVASQNFKRERVQLRARTDFESKPTTSWYVKSVCSKITAEGEKF